MKNIILVSGGFDPIHQGHIKLIKEASKYGSVVVLLNSDEWLRKKKGKEFHNFEERKIIMESIKGVIEVIAFDDSDTTCIDGIKKAKAKYANSTIKLANGGDRNQKTTPEKNIVKKIILKLFEIGGKNKANSSSWLLKKWTEN